MEDFYKEKKDEMGVHRIPAIGRYVLTVAHPNHDPENPDAELRAWCAPCHCRYDLRQKKAKADDQTGIQRSDVVAA